MLTDDQISAGMGAARDQILAMVKGHEDAAHDGGVCNRSRAGTLAFLAHSLGMRSDNTAAMVKFIKSLQGYEERCPCCSKGGNHE